MRNLVKHMVAPFVVVMAIFNLTYVGPLYANEGGGNSRVEKGLDIIEPHKPNSIVMQLLDKNGSPTDTYVRIQNGSICDETTGARNVEAVFYSDVWGTVPKCVSNLTIKVRRQLYDLATNTETYTYPTFVVSGYSATIVYCEVQEGIINGAYVETRYNPENFEGADYTAINW